MNELNLSTSQAGVYNTCVRKWYYSYRRNWKDVGSAASDFGSAWHAAMDSLWMHACNSDLWEQWDAPVEGALFHAKKAFDQTWYDKRPEEEEKDYRNPALGHAMLEAYAAANWDKIKGFELLEIEGSFTVPVQDGLNSAGRIDKVIRDRKTNLTYVVDHKTTGRYSRDFGIQPRWWEAFLMSPQVASYLDYANRTYGEKNVGGFVVDAALVHKTARHFERRVFNRSLPQLKSFRDELALTAAGMQFHDERAFYPKNLSACDDFGGCPYQPLCTQFNEVKDLPSDPPEWAEKVRVSTSTTEDRLGIDTGKRP